VTSRAQRKQSWKGTGEEVGILPVVEKHGAAGGNVPDHRDVLDVMRVRVPSVRRRVAIETVSLEIQNGRHQLQRRVLAGRLHVAVDAAAADGSGCLAVKRFLEVVLVVPWHDVGRVTFAFLVVGFGMDD
jgi:hypothetical protein